MTFEATSQILIATGQVLIAAIVAYIAVRDFKINRANHRLQKDTLRLDLFDRRYKVFDAFRALFLSFMIAGKVDRDTFSKFIINTSDAEFLFGKEINSYRKEIIDRSVELMGLEHKLERQTLDSDGRRDIANKMERLEKWFSNQSDRSRNLFYKYLHFSIDKEPLR